MRGKEIALRDVAMRDVPACPGCHPRILSAQLLLFRAEKRGGTHFLTSYAECRENLSDEEITALAAYFAQRHLPSF